MSPVKLSANFLDSEFDAKSSNGRYPDAWRATKLRQLATLAQWLRDLARSRGDLTSVYRSPERNAEVGGTETSQHMKGEAFDIVFRLASLRAIAGKVLADRAAGRAPAFGQLIFYADKGHIHGSLATLGPRNGEIRYSFLSTRGDERTRVYPTLTASSQIPLITGSQARAGSAAAAAIAAIAAIAVVVLVVRGS